MIKKILFVNSRKIKIQSSTFDDKTFDDKIPVNV